MMKFYFPLKNKVLEYKIVHQNSVLFILLFLIFVNGENTDELNKNAYSTSLRLELETIITAQEEYCSLNLGLYTCGLLFTGILLSIFALQKLNFRNTRDEKSHRILHFLGTDCCNLISLIYIGFIGLIWLFIDALICNPFLALGSIPPTLIMMCVCYFKWLLKRHKKLNPADTSLPRLESASNLDGRVNKNGERDPLLGSLLEKK